MNKIFFKVHDLLKKRDYQTIIDELLNNEGEISSEYEVDLNHAWYLVGNAFSELEKYDSALSAFQKSYTEDESDYMALMAQASCCSELGAHTSSELLLKLAIALSNENCDHYYNLGNSLFDQGKYSQAIDAYEQVEDQKGESYELAVKNIKAARGRLDGQEKVNLLRLRVEFTQQ